MGTSKPYDGPSDKTPLLPDWAQISPTVPPLEPPLPINPLPQAPAAPAPNGPAIPQLPGLIPGTPSPPILPSKPQFPAPHRPPIQPRPTSPTPTGGWTSAKVRMSAYASSGGKGRLRNAARRYVRARGGSKRAAASATGGQAATAGLGGFLADVANRGFAEATTSLGLTNLLGQPVEAALAAMLNAIAPAGATADDITARRADADALAVLFQRFKAQEGGLAKLNAMDAGAVKDVIQVSVASYIYHRWLLDLGKRVEERAVSPKQAVKLEREVKEHVKNLVKINLHGRDVLKIDWHGAEGRQFTQQIYEEAYELLGRSPQ
jgi:hypothetical protein